MLLKQSVDPHRLLSREFPPVEHAYGTRDCVLYALGIGLGSDPLDAAQLQYVYEDAPRGLQALPTLVNVLGYAGFWAKEPDTGITWQKVVHAEQAIELYRPLPVAGRVIGLTRVTAVHDKGPAKGALMVQERLVKDAASGELLARVTQTSMLRGDGGFGGSVGTPLEAPHSVPDRQPDGVCDLVTLPQAALLYRLNGDFNPLHADPAVAQSAGFDRPILHGLCTMGVALHAVLKSAVEYDAARVRGLRVRFTSPVLPGETIRTEWWRDGSVISFRSSVVERRVVVLNAGRVDIVPS